MNRIVFSACLVVTLSAICAAQSSGGGAAAGIGRSYEAAGGSAAASKLKRNIGSTLIKAVAREKAASKQRTSTSNRSNVARPTSATRANAVTSGADSAAFFKPDPKTDTLTLLANDLGTNATERQQLLQLFTATKSAFEKEVAAKGRSNNLPAAFTFFIASTVTVFRDDPEPSDQALDNLWDGISGALSETPELAKLTNTEKQQLYDMLVAFSGFVLAGYMEAKNSNDTETLKVFQALSGELVRSILKTDPTKLRFSKDGLDIIG